MEWIEVTERNEEIKVLVPIDKIMSVSEQKQGCFIEVGVEKNGESLGMYTIETYEEVVSKISAPFGTSPSKRSILGVLEDKIKKSNLI